MALPRPESDRPYLQFNFVVEINEKISGGFQEVTGIGSELVVTEYRNGNDKDNNVRKLTGLNKSTDVTLKRGVFGNTDLYEWLDSIRKGKTDGIRDVKIRLKTEDSGSDQAVLTWTLRGARITKYTSGPFNAKGNDVAMEELVLAYQRMDLE